MQTAASILVVEDQEDLRENIDLALTAEGYNVFTAGTGVEALKVMKNRPVNLIISDVVMPEMDGYQLYLRVREQPQWITVPFIFLTALDVDSDVRYGKELGVDDYLVKPVDRTDLLAAIRGNLQRAEQLAGELQMAKNDPPPKSPPAQESGTLTLGRLTIAPQQYRAWLDGQLIDVSPREFKLLAYLARHANRVVPMPELLEATHNVQADPARAEHLLRPLVRALRRKLGHPPGESGCIQNMHGLGYCLNVPV